ncbi:MAG: enoyl-CoA hydratase/isomerase family protein [Planctomycetota bacterium]|jgi:enoyl-CoA hydratase
MNDSSSLLTERTDDGILFVTLNRPEKRNALDQAMVTALHTVLDTVEGEPPGEGTRALVLMGAGEKAFAAGADIGQLLARTHKDALNRINSSLFERLERLRCPTIAAVHGWTLGGGAELALACDIRIAARSVKMGQPEVSLGIIPAAGATYRLPRLVGFGKARELIFTGRIIDADEALAIGLVERVVDDQDLREAALGLAREIAKNAPLAVQLAKVMLNTAARGAHLSEMESITQAILFESEEKHVRMQAFLDRKAARRPKT